MSRKRTQGIVALALALILALVPVSIAGVQPGATPDAINWGKIAGYAECGISVYIGVQTGGATAWLAAAICLHALADQDN
jgi:hypothetical protein